MSTGHFIAFVTGNNRGREAVDRLHGEVIRTSNEAVSQANQLEDTIREMVNRKRRLRGLPTDDTPRKST